MTMQAHCHKMLITLLFPRNPTPKIGTKVLILRISTPILSVIRPILSVIRPILSVKTPILSVYIIKYKKV